MAGTAAADLTAMSARVFAARTPEDLFGPADEAKRNYRLLAQAVHPDRHTNGDRDEAEQVMARVNELWLLAKQSLRDGIYGTGRGPTANPLRIMSRRGRYTLGRLWRTDELSYHYLASSDDGDRVVRVVRRPAENNRLANEATMLRHLYLETRNEPGLRAYLPKLTDAFALKQGGVNRRAHAFEHLDGLWTLQAVIDAHPNGVNPKDAAWIFRRLLVAVGYAHTGGVVHAAVLPSNVLVHPGMHGLVLANWAYARADGSALTAIDGRWRDLYPSEVLGKEPATRETDIYMAAMTMIRVLGGRGRDLPHTVPLPLRAFFKGCTIDRASRRPDNAWLLKDTFDQVLQETFGPRRFHPFAMPATAKEA